MNWDSGDTISNDIISVVTAKVIGSDADGKTNIERFWLSTAYGLSRT